MAADSSRQARVLRTEDGREVILGSEAELNAAWQDIMGATGGSSGRGQFSYLFGLRPDEAMPADLAARLAEEAAEFKLLIGRHLRSDTIALLDRLSTLRGS